jgi:hypothetical protein
MSTPLTPGERRELRTVVRQRMKVLRADVQQRRAELLAEAEQRLMERYRDQDKAIEDLNWKITEIAEQASREITDVIIAARGDEDGVSIRRPVQLRPPPTLRLHREPGTAPPCHGGRDRITGQKRTAGARPAGSGSAGKALTNIESDAAREFLGSIPTLAELVPSARLREIEAAFDGGGAA